MAMARKMSRYLVTLSDRTYSRKPKAPDELSAVYRVVGESRFVMWTARTVDDEGASVYRVRVTANDRRSLEDRFDYISVRVQRIN